jgi:uncharacterized protein
MEFKFIETKEKYDGSQLVSLRSYLKHKILGDSIVAWIGACDIPFEHMVDGEDLNAQAEIRGDRMVHFVVEKFDSTLLAAVALQRLLASIVRDYLVEKSGERKLASTLYRSGDDIYARSASGAGNGKKLSISIATQSPVSSLIHFAVNVTNKGTPVKTLSLEDLDVDPKKFATEVMKRFAREVETIREATMKVRWVK